MSRLTHLSLFSGIGGFDIAAEWAGFTTVCFVELDPFCQKVLKKHWPDVSLIKDIKDVTKEKVVAYTASARSGSSDRDSLHQGRSTGESGGEGLPKDTEGRNGIAVADIESADIHGRTEGRGEPTVDLITAGVPCQPISVAGKRRGEADDRWLWPETIRVLSEVRPTWACFENPAGILTMGFDNLLSQMEECGYETQTFIVPACAVNAPHRRDRVWIVAYNGLPQSVELSRSIAQCRNGLGNSGQDVADTARSRLSVSRSEGIRGQNSEGCQGTEYVEAEGSGSRLGEWHHESSEGWNLEPDVGRVAHGVPSRVHRLKALGNAVVPQQAYPILKAIADTYEEVTH